MMLRWTGDRAKTNATATTNTGILRFAPNDDKREDSDRNEDGRCSRKATAKAIAKADPYGMTNKRTTTNKKK